MNNIRVLICCVLFCASGWAHSTAIQPGSGQEFIARIIVVLDGDTVLVRRASGLLKIRLAEIDAPEKAQAFGEISKRSLSGMVLGKQVNVVSQAVDQYGRMVAHLSVNGLDVNTEQIRRGMAWAAVGWRQSRRAAPRPPEGRVSDETTDMTTSHLTNPAKDAGQVIGYSQSTGLVNNANQVAGYGGVPFTGAPTGVPLAGDYSNFASLAASRQSLRDPLHSNKALITLQNEAKQATRGLWALSNPIPPWEWRKLHPSISPGAVAATVTDHAAMPGIGCSKKKYCSEMSSCEEAKYYLTQCGVKSLDANGDGTPCEQLCAPQKEIKN